MADIELINNVQFEADVELPQWLQGTGIQSVIQTITSTEDDGINVITVTLTDGKQFTFDIKNGSGIADIVQTVTSNVGDGVNTVTVTLSNGTQKSFNIKNGTGIASIDQITESAVSDGVNVIRATLTNGVTHDFNIKNGTGVSSIEQITTSTEDEGVNVITATLSNGETSTFNIINGSKGSKGDQGDIGPRGYYIERANYVADSDSTPTVETSSGLKHLLTFYSSDGSTQYGPYEVYNGERGLKGDKGDPFTYNDLTIEQKREITPQAGVDYYTAAEKAELVSEIVAAAGGLQYVFLGAGQYDENGVPTVEGRINTFYFVPDTNGDSPNLFIEFLYTQNGWEQVGASTISLDGYATEDWVKDSYITYSTGGVMVTPNPTE